MEHATANAPGPMWQDTLKDNGFSTISIPGNSASTSFLNVSGEYLVNQDFIIGVVGLIIHLYQNKRILCKEKEIDTLKAFLWNMGQKEIL